MMRPIRSIDGREWECPRCFGTGQIGPRDEQCGGCDDSDRVARLDKALAEMWPAPLPLRPTPGHIENVRREMGAKS